MQTTSIRNMVIPISESLFQNQIGYVCVCVCSRMALALIPNFNMSTPFHRHQFLLGTNTKGWFIKCDLRYNVDKLTIANWFCDCLLVDVSYDFGYNDLEYKNSARERKNLSAVYFEFIYISMFPFTFPV